MQVHTLMSAHVVGLARIHEEIRLGASCDTCFEERQAVLGHYCNVVVSLYNLQFTLKVFALYSSDVFL